MTDAAMTEVVGLFESRHQAERAVDELHSMGYDADTVGYVDRHRDEQGEIVTDEGHTHETDRADTGSAVDEAAKGAGGGAVGGATVGAGAGLLARPGCW
jgi:hypothetical protein